MSLNLSVWNIARENVRRRLFRSIGLASVVAIFSLTLSGGSMLAQNIRNGIDVMSERLGADIMVVPSAHEQNFEGALLRGEPGTFYLDGRLTDEIRRLPGVLRASPQLFVASLDAACCTMPVQLIGYEQESDFVIAPWLAAQGLSSMGKALTEGEALAGVYILGKPGGTLTFFDQPVRIAASLDKTGMGFDTSVFMSMATARQLMHRASEKAQSLPAAQHSAKEALISLPEGIDMGVGAGIDAPVSSIMIRVTEGYDVNRVAYDILRNFAARFGVRAVIAKNMVRNTAEKLQGLAWLIYGLAAVFWGVAFGVLAAVFSVMFNERKREFSILRILGATRGKIVAMVLSESLIISALGAAAGIMLAALAVFPFNTWIGLHIGLPYLQPGPTVWLVLAAGSFVLALLVGPLACGITVFRIGRLEVYTSMREGE